MKKIIINAAPMHFVTVWFTHSQLYVILLLLHYPGLSFLSTYICCEKERCERDNVEFGSCMILSLLSVTFEKHQHHESTNPSRPPLLIWISVAMVTG